MLCHQGSSHLLLPQVQQSNHLRVEYPWMHVKGMNRMRPQAQLLRRQLHLLLPQMQQAITYEVIVHI